MSGTLAIPAADIVGVIPSVLSAGGSALDLNGLCLTTSPRIPIGTVRTFASKADIGLLFGAISQEATLGGVYFAGFDGSTKKPGALLYTQYNQSNVGAWLRGGSLTAEGMTLSQLQALSGTVIITIDGTPLTSSPINLSSATSFSNAAELVSIATGLVGSTAASFTATISGTTLNVSAVSSGTLAVGQEVRGSGVSAGTLISAFGTGVGGTGTYTVTNSQTVSSGSMTGVNPTVTYDSVTGSFLISSPTTGASSTISYATGTISTALNLTQATGAVISQGAVAAVPAAFMANVLVQTQNWASLMTAFDPDNGSGNSVKQAFATWVNSVQDRFLYVAWDTDITPTLSSTATASLGAIINVSQSNGTAPIYSPAQGPTIAAFLMGAVASVDFAAIDGRATMKFRKQAGIVPDVVNQTVEDNLIANGYNFYGAWGTANQLFNFFSPGQVSGAFDWIDSYVNQIWFNNQLQLAGMVLMTNVKHMQYNQEGLELIRAAFRDPINQAVNNGVIEPGVPLSAAQIAEVNAAAGLSIDTTLSNQGWYLQVLNASPQVRVARGSPPCNLWYMDGQSIHKITLASILVQ